MKITKKQKLYLKYNSAFVGKLYLKFGSNIMDVVLSNFFIFNFLKNFFIYKKQKISKQIKGLII